MGLPPWILIVAVIFLGLAAYALIHGLVTGQVKGTRRLQAEGLWPPSDQKPTLEDVQRLAAAGYKIDAIKMYREITGLGLKESKDAVETLLADK